MKKSITFKSIVGAVALTLTIAAPLKGQDLTSYFMTDAVSRQMHNASFAPDRGYFNIPLVGNMSLSTSGNLSLGDLVFPSGGELLPIFDTRVSVSQALSGLKDNNNFGLENRISLLGFGAYCKDRTSFWSFDLNLRTSTNFSMPYEFFEFFKAAPEQCTINDVNIYMESYVEAAFGYSKMVDNKLTVGGRVKFLAGLFNADMNIDKMDITMSSNVWTAQAQGTLDINAAGTGVSGDKSVFDLGDIETDITGPAGYGAALDLGATYKYSDRLTFSLAANDLGFILWGKDNNTHATVANEFEFSGAKVDGNGDVDDATDAVELDDIEFVAEDSRGSQKWLQSSIVAGAEYTFFSDKLGVGAIYSARFWRSQAVHNLTTSVRFSPVGWFTLAGSYAFANNKAHALGLAANLATGFCNLYVATDVLTSRKSAQYIPIDQSMMNITFGLAVPLGKKGERGEKGSI